MMTGKKNINAITVILMITMALLIMLSLFDVPFSADETTDSLISNSVVRLLSCVIIVILLSLLGYKRVFTFKLNAVGKSLLWCLPCFLVAIVNFPISSLLRGLAEITRYDLIWLFGVKCLSIGVAEELLFRGIILTFCLQRFKNDKGRIFKSIMISSLVFGLWHLANLLGGAGIGGTLAQVAYTTLMGIVFAMTMIKTGNVVFSIAIHTLFDIGGLLIADIGTGLAQDRYFWIATVCSGILCAAHLFITFYRAKNCYADEIPDTFTLADKKSKNQDNVTDPKENVDE